MSNNGTAPIKISSYQNNKIKGIIVKILYIKTKRQKIIIKKRSGPSSELELAPDEIPRAESSSSVSEFSIFSHFNGLRVSLSLPIIASISGIQESLF